MQHRAQKHVWRFTPWNDCQQSPSPNPSCLLAMYSNADPEPHLRQPSFARSTTCLSSSPKQLGTSLAASTCRMYHGHGFDSRSTLQEGKLIICLIVCHLLATISTSPSVHRTTYMSAFKVDAGKPSTNVAVQIIFIDTGEKKIAKNYWGYNTAVLTALENEECRGVRGFDVGMQGIERQRVNCQRVFQRCRSYHRFSLMWRELGGRWTSCSCLHTYTHMLA